ncbi:MAG: RDD family protein [Clostridia bacterium]|nr:RDD family protein [Clostridia bacterium]
MIFDIQKASILKRVSAFILDLILFAILAVGIAALIGLACDYDGQIEKLENYFSSYKAEYELEYGVDLDISETDYNMLTEAEKQNWQDAYNACNEALNADAGATATFIRIISYTLLMVSLGILVSMAILEFAFPLFFKNGQTIGKKVFGIGVIHQNGVRVNVTAMFVRTFLGKYTVETMVPVLLLYMMFALGTGIMSIIVIALLLVLQLGIFIYTKKTRCLIHDVFAKTVCIDIASQKIFDNVDEMNAFKQNAYAESSQAMSENKIYETANTVTHSLVQLDKKDDTQSNDDNGDVNQG